MTYTYPKILLSVALVSLLATGCATKEESTSVKRGATVGALSGGLMGLALGAMSGDADIAFASAAVGATMGGATGAMHELKNTRENQRNQILSDAIAGKNTSPEANSQASTLIQNLLGEWNMSVWSVVQDGTRIEGTGLAKGIMESKSTLTLDISDIDFPGVAEDLTGVAIFSFDEKKGYTLEITSSTNQYTESYIGEYIKADDVYNFYATEKDRSSVRLQLRANNESMWSLETYIQKGDQEVQTQSYRFMKR